MTASLWLTRHLAFYANPVEEEVTELPTTLATHHMMRPINPPVHPGAILREEFLAPLGMSAGALVKRIPVPRARIERLVAGVTVTFYLTP
jgi:hypothetical protein